ncbi:hypothetical protein D3C72_1267720 [compost metagenome]
MYEVVNQMQGAVRKCGDAGKRLTLPILDARFLLHLDKRQDGALRRAHVVRDEAQCLFTLALGLANAGNIRQCGDGAREIAFGGVDGRTLQDQVAARVIAHFQIGRPTRCVVGGKLAAQGVGYTLPRRLVRNRFLKQVRGGVAHAGRAHAQPLEVHDRGLVAKLHVPFLVEDERRVGHAVQTIGQEAPQVTHALQRALQFAYAAFQRCIRAGQLGARLVQDGWILALQPT